MTKEQIQDYTLKITQASRSQLVVILYDMAIDYMNEAIKEQEEDNHIAFRDSCLRAGRVVQDLIGAIDFTYALSMPLYRIYEYVAKEISMAVIKNDVTGIKASIKFFESLKGSFEQIAESDYTGSVMGNAQAVYTGLTYGKGMLNDNVTLGSNNRGYIV